MLWVAVRRFAVPLGGRRPWSSSPSPSRRRSPPTAPRSTPSCPAALAVTVAVAALTGRSDRRGRRRCSGWRVVALPWLAVKYAPVAAALAGRRAGAAGARGDRRAGGRLVGGAGGRRASSSSPLHQALYGGWTVYAAGDHFVGGEFTVVGRRARLPGPSRPAGRAARRPRASAWPPGSRPSCSSSPRSWPRSPAAGRRAGPRWRCRSRPGGSTPPSSRSRCTAGGGPAVRSWWSCPAVAGRRPGGPTGPRRASWGRRRRGRGAHLGVAGRRGRRRGSPRRSTSRPRRPAGPAWRLVLPDYLHVSATTWVLHGAWLVTLGAWAVVTARPRKVQSRLRSSGIASSRRA